MLPMLRMQDNTSALGSRSHSPSLSPTQSKRRHSQELCTCDSGHGHCRVLGAHSAADCKRFLRAAEQVHSAPVQENSSVYFKSFQSSNDNTLVVVGGDRMTSLRMSNSMIEGRAGAFKIVQWLADSISRASFRRAANKPEEIILDHAFALGGAAADLEQLLGVRVSIAPKAVARQVASL